MVKFQCSFLPCRKFSLNEEEFLNYIKILCEYKQMDLDEFKAQLFFTTSTPAESETEPSESTTAPLESVTALEETC